MKNTDTILGFIAGASIGAIAGILLAPDSGAATRQKIADRTGDLKDAVKDRVSGLYNKLQQDVEDEVHAAAPTSAGEEKIRQVMHHVKESIS